MKRDDALFKVGEGRDVLIHASPRKPTNDTSEVYITKAKYCIILSVLMSGNPFFHLGGKFLEDKKHAMFAKRRLETIYCI